MSYPQLSPFERLTGPTQQTLFSLEEGSKNGRELQNDLGQSYNLWLEPSTLYGVLRQLEQHGWIAPFGAEQSARSYALTERGRAMVAQHRISHTEKRDRIGLNPLHHRQKEYIMHIITWILRLYPLAWRKRYEYEMRILLEEYDVTIFTWLDLLLGALDARIDPHYRTAQPLSPIQRFQRMRTASIITFCTFPLSFLCYFVFIVDEVDGPWDTLRQAQQPIVVLASALGAIAIIIWIVTILAAILLLAYHSLRKSTTCEPAWLALLPILGVLMAGGALASHFLFSWSWLNGVEFLLFWLGLLLVPTSIALAIARSKIRESTLQIFLILGTLMSAGMALYQLSLLIDQGVTSFLWPGGNWSFHLIAGLFMMILPTIIASWLLIRSWIALPPSNPSTPITEMLPLQQTQ